jgi:uncharacterized protein (UPF0248 family)
MWRVVAVNPPERPHHVESPGSQGLDMLSNPELTNAERFIAFVDVEKIPLHRVVIIAAELRLIWATRGPEPFMGVDFVLRQVASKVPAA